MYDTGRDKIRDSIYLSQTEVFVTSSIDENNMSKIFIPST